MIFKCNLVKDVNWKAGNSNHFVFAENFENQMAELSSLFSSAVEKSQMHLLYERQHDMVALVGRVILCPFYSKSSYVKWVNEGWNEQAQPLDTLLGFSTSNKPLTHPPTTKMLNYQRVRLQFTKRVIPQSIWEKSKGKWRNEKDLGVTETRFKVPCS